MAIESQGANGQGAAGFINNLNSEDAQQMIEQSRAAVEEAMDTAATFIRERPIVCLAGALAFGYLLGKVVSR
ncbi:MAG TPA: hypothetical protein VGH20_14195 [Myxococcales bacterium]|jgi:ElaB/YqjD/DUF883 family membrane-anchored ribosome-binding protein